ncbi:hypothetical protein ScPMuIL_002375 [Solemya velum]
MPPTTLSQLRARGITREERPEASIHGHDQTKEDKLRHGHDLTKEDKLRLGHDQTKEDKRQIEEDQTKEDKRQLGHDQTKEDKRQLGHDQTKEDKRQLGHHQTTCFQTVGAQVQFRDVSFVKSVVTQGREADRHSACCTRVAYVPKYTVQTSLDGKTWNYVKDATGNNQVFQGNTDGSTEVTRHLSSCPFLARYLRILPSSWWGVIALRFDVIGCTIITKSASIMPLVGTSPHRPPISTTQMPSATKVSPVTTPQRKDGCVTSVADCFILGEGDHQACGTCLGYTTCTMGRALKRQCPAGLVWNNKLKICDWTSPTCP